MAEQGVLYAQKLFMDQYQLSGRMTAISFECGIEGQPSTQYNAVRGQGTTQRTEDPGLAFARLGGSALFEANGSDAIEDILSGGFRLSNRLITFCPLLGAAAGAEPVYLLRAIEVELRQGAKIGEMLQLNFAARLSDRWMPGFLGFNTVDGLGISGATGTAQQLGAIASGKSLYGAMHATGMSGVASYTITIESDDNSGFTTPTTRATFAATSGITSEWLTPVAGPVTDDWWRMKYTTTGTTRLAQIVASMAIQ